MQIECFKATTLGTLFEKKHAGTPEPRMGYGDCWSGEDPCGPDMGRATVEIVEVVEAAQRLMRYSIRLGLLPETPIQPQRLEIDHGASGERLHSRGESQ